MLFFIVEMKSLGINNSAAIKKVDLEDKRTPVIGGLSATCILNCFELFVLCG